MQALRLILLLAARSLVAHRAKSFVIGALLFGGTFVVVLGDALLDSVEEQMRTTLTGSLVGEFQVQDAKAGDPLAIFGGGAGAFGSQDLGEIPHFEEIERALGEVEGVKGLVPMGITSATVFGRNEIDRVLTALRDALREDRWDEAARQVARARRIVAELDREGDTGKAIAAPELYQRTREALDRVADPAFWAVFEPPPPTPAAVEVPAGPEAAPAGEAGAPPATDRKAAALEALDFLDSRIAPIATDGDLMYFQIVGTDPERFTAAFPRFRLVEGQEIPPGRPGLLINHRVYEQMVKNRVARELDRVLESVREGDRIADDPLLQQRVRRLADQYRLVTFQLEPEEAEALGRELAELLGAPGELDAQVRSLLTVDDSNVEARHAWFYEHVATRIELHQPTVGQTVTLRGFTQSGYLRAVEVPVYGTYDFEGLEEADVAGAPSLVDLVTFRELYGKMSDEAREELAGIRASVGVKEVSREDAEAALFGGGDSGGSLEVAVAAPAGLAVDIARVAATDPFEKTFPVEQTRTGLVLNAAILLEDPLALEEVRPALQRAAEGLGLRLMDWKEAAGTLGQLVTVLRLVLLTAVAMIFVVALIIVNNAMVMATIDRVPEIGTLRAIGAPRSTVLGLFLAETAILGLVAGGLGGLAAVGTVAWLGRVGIPAPAEQLVILFGGPRLYPSIGPEDIALGLVTITTVAVASTLYPATLAARVPPVVALRGRE